MSNDLISRSALIDELKQSGMIADNDYGNAMVDFIKKLPTAYDVDKVVEQLEEIHEEILTDTAYDNDTVNHYLDYADLMIEDVKAGGVNE